MIRNLFILLIPLMVFGQSTARRLEYMDSHDRPMTSYQEWKSRTSLEPFALGTVYNSREGFDQQDLVDVVVYAPLYTGIMDSLAVYVSDLEAEGYAVQVDTMRGWTAVELRDHFDSLLSYNLVGAVLIGNVPFAWYEMSGGDGREEFPIDLAIIDLGLPELPGLEVIRKLRSRGRDFPILVLTARTEWQDKVTGLEAGADDYVVKPDISGDFPTIQAAARHGLVNTIANPLFSHHNRVRIP